MNYTTYLEALKRIQELEELDAESALSEKELVEYHELNEKIDRYEYLRST